MTTETRVPDLSEREQERAALRDQLALAATPVALNCAMTGWDHICPSVIERAARSAYEVADGILAYRDKMAADAIERGEAGQTP